MLSESYRELTIRNRRQELIGCCPYREGTHAKYHYMICGVQGDFTKSLVANPPSTIWTRQLKVC